MWKNIVLIAFVFLFIGPVYAQVDNSLDSNEWKEEKSKHFIIYYQEASSKYISKVKRYAEHYYKSITNYLGFRRFNFWTWEKRCKIYLYPSREEYLKDTGRISWSKGSVHVIKKEIVTYAREAEFFDHVLPHEMGHIIFRELVGFDKKLSLWIDEAVAVLQEEDRAKYLAGARNLARQGNYVFLSELASVSDYGQIRPDVFYSQAASIVHFLLEKFGRNKFVIFCRCLRDGEGWEEALLSTYKFENLEGLEKAWINSLSK